MGVRARSIYTDTQITMMVPLSVPQHYNYMLWGELFGAQPWYVRIHSNCSRGEGRSCSPLDFRGLWLSWNVWNTPIEREDTIQEAWVWNSEPRFTNIFRFLSLSLSILIIHSFILSFIHSFSSCQTHTHRETNVSNYTHIRAVICLKVDRSIGLILVSVLPPIDKSTVLLSVVLGLHANSQGVEEVQQWRRHKW